MRLCNTVAVSPTACSSFTLAHNLVCLRICIGTDVIDCRNVKIEHCPTDVMVADFLTKPLQGTKFREFRKSILGL